MPTSVFLASPSVSVGSSGVSGAISSVLHVNTTQVGTIADTNETDLWSYALPANTLSADGKGVRIRAWGTTGATANTKTLRLYVGATALFTLGPSAYNNLGWHIDAIVVRTGAATQLAETWAVIGVVTGAVNQGATPAADTTAAITLKVTGQNGTAAANDVVLKGAIVEALN